ncbi:MAG TPA: acVLRF1 family peptidyl-tRNA hydrolase [Candidatus Dormibacteraeota bacterium]
MTVAARHPAAGGGRWVVVAPERLERWLLGFADRHGTTAWEAGPSHVIGTAADGARAECEVPFPPLDADAEAPHGGLVAHARAERTVGVLLVRLGGFAVGVFSGRRRLASKVGSRPVHARTSAGGWSQQRFARRREAQAKVAIETAAEVAERILLPWVDRLEAVVVGGDRRAVDAVLADPRLVRLNPLVRGRLLDVPDPGQRVLEQAHENCLKVHIRVVDADWGPAVRLP